MQRVQIIGAPFSSYVWIVRMALEEKQVPYDLIPERMHSAEVLAIHPFGKIPVMRHGDVTLCESKAIVTYIDRTFAGPKLIPDDVRGAAEVEQWVSLVNTAIDPCLIRNYIFSYLFPKGADGKPDRAAIGAVLPAMQAKIDVLDKAVARSGHLVGDSFTLADIYAMPVLEVSHTVTIQLSSGKRREIGYVDCNLFEVWEQFDAEEGMEREGLIRFPVEGYHRTVFLNPADLDYVSLPTHKIEADRTDSYDDGLLDAPVQAKRAQIRRVK